MSDKTKRAAIERAQEEEEQYLASVAVTTAIECMAQLTRYVVRDKFTEEQAADLAYRLGVHLAKRISDSKV